MEHVRRVIPKVKAEIPEPKRCCFCIPLRHGLLVWGYVKLVLALVVFTFSSLIMQTYMQFIVLFGPGYVIYIGAGMVMLLLLMIDMGMTIVFLVGGHRKTPKLLQIFYIYSVIVVVIGTLLNIVFVSLRESYNPKHPRNYGNYNIFRATEIVFGVVSFCVQVYIIILLRSEINKLNRRREFKLSNITKEVECIGSTQNGNIESGSMYEQGNERTITDMEHSDGDSFNYSKF